jgi:hypothetical protein
MDLRPIKWITAILFALFLLPGVLRADDVSVSASLSDATTTVGEAVELHIAVNGTQQISGAPEIRADGLDINYAGASSSFNMINGQTSITITLNYMVVPHKEGKFAIPAVQVQAGGKTLVTRPLTLTVEKEPNSNGSGQGSNGNDSLAFAEWVIPKTSLYVGEIVPAELRVYVDSRIQCSLQSLPAVNGDGFTVQKMGEPHKKRVNRNGRQYDVLIFKTAVTPVKLGDLTLGPTTIDAVALVPQKRPRGSRIPGAPPGFEDMFNDPFFNQAFMTQQQLKIQTESVPIQVKALPKAGQPKGFSGAIGKFTLTTKASPTKVHAGDPITLTAEVSGIGNFDRVSGVQVADEPGWRAYPPNGKFKADDEVGASGTKTFEEALIPEQPKAELPKVEFSYFDPSLEKYVTLTGDKIPIEVEGSAMPSATPAPAVSSNPANSSSPSATPAPQKPTDILYILTDAGSWGETFEPIWKQRWFWLAQLLPATALLGYLGWGLRQLRNADLNSKRLAALRANKAEALRALRSPNASPRDFYAAAVKVLQFEAAANLDRDPSTIDAETVCASRRLDAETAEEVRRIFANHDEMIYAGSGGGTAVAPDRQQAVVRIIEKFEKSHA